MLIGGEWLLCEDGIERPVFRGEILSDSGTWLEAPFLADPGADCTALSADILAFVRQLSFPSAYKLGGVGGVAASVAVQTKIRLFREDKIGIVFRGEFGAFTDPKTLEMSVLGRDITNLFALIVDRPGNLVCLLGQRHRYVIQQE
jgi:hypothetical protein